MVCSQPDSLWPWAEHNAGLIGAAQGALALLALAVALLALVREASSARRAGEQRLREYVDFVLALIDTLAGEGAEALARFTEVEGPNFIMPTLSWLNRRQLTASALQTATASPPPDPRLAVLIAGLLRSFSVGQTFFSGRDGARDYLAAQLEELKQTRAQIAARRP